MSYYSVACGRKVGIFTNWPECEESVKGFNGARFKKFGSLNEAKKFCGIDDSLNSTGKESARVSQNNIKHKRKRPSENDDLSDAGNLIVFYHDAADPKRVVVYTDGSCKGPPGSRRAGYGVFWGPDHPWNRSERLKGEQTNNRAEIEAAITAIERAQKSGILHLGIVTDSKFTQQCATEWGPRWKNNSWKLSTGENAILREPVERLLKAISRPEMDVSWHHVAAHQGNFGNEQADALANEGADKSSSESD